MPKIRDRLIEQVTKLACAICLQVLKEEDSWCAWPEKGGICRRLKLGIDQILKVVYPAVYPVARRLPKHHELDAGHVREMWQSGEGMIKNPIKKHVQTEVKG